MRVLFLIFVLFLHPLKFSKCQTCTEPSVGGSMYLRLHSRRNKTGHHTVEIVLDTKAQMGAGETDLGTVDASQKSTLCDGFEIFTTRVEVTAPPAIYRTPGYEIIPGFGYYKYYIVAQTWDDAVKTCIKDNAHLMIVNSEAEVGIFRGFAARNNTVGATWASWYYIGFHDRGIEGQYMTVLGGLLKESGYVVWSPNQPDNTPWGLEGDQDCGGINRIGQLQDLPCVAKAAFICEQPL